jgi:hypothetical protein
MLPGNGWKFSVKSRTFVDGESATTRYVPDVHCSLEALCNFYTTKFAAPPEGEAATDGWTLKILSKVISERDLGELATMY